MGEGDERKSQYLVFTGEGMEGEDYFLMLGQRRVTPRWADDSVRR